MRKRIPVLMVLFIAVAGAGISPGAGRVAGPAHGDAGRLVSGDSGRKEVSLTVYNGDLGLVREIREVDLPAGILALEFADVASRIDPATVLVRSVGGSSGLRVIEQNYEYDLLNPQKLLDKYVGRMVTLRTSTGAAIKARLLSSNNGPIYEIDGEIHMGHPGQVVLPGIPEDLISRPTLVWRLDNASAGARRVEASYLTSGMTWKADYVLALDVADERADLSGWVTLDNRSGATYRDATLKLVAGDVNRARSDNDPRGVMMKMAAADAARESTFKEEGFFEYHLYSLEGRTTVKDNQTKQISLLSAGGVPVAKRLVFFGAGSYYRGRFGSPISNQKVGVFLEIANTAASRLGLPLPRGIVRVYKADAGGSMQFVGEDAIDHTPKDETIRIKMGDAFDVVGERQQTDYRVLGEYIYEIGWKVTLRNHKDEAVQVAVVEPIPGDWTITQSTHSYEKTEAHTLRYDVTVPANGQADVAYRARIRF